MSIPSSATMFSSTVFGIAGSRCTKGRPSITQAVAAAPNSVPGTP